MGSCLHEPLKQIIGIMFDDEFIECRVDGRQFGLAGKKHRKGFDMDRIEVQVQDSTGNWRTYNVTQNNSQLIQMAMRTLKEQFPDQRVRAVDQDGRLIDIIM